MLSNYTMPEYEIFEENYSDEESKEIKELQ